jgi:hypothetical protein
MTAAATPSANPASRKARGQGKAAPYGTSVREMTA